ncbi:MAG: diacylglycerol kinase family lipid kinase [Ilumatobacteraceae bacterium]|nr:diacylglycerol kinase family lipid kinase [Ilumatobacteraceae bacterium]
MSDVTVVYNPKSGSAITVGDLERAFAPHESAHRIRWSPTTADDPGPGQTAEAIERGCDTVVACGGDGTVRAVAETLAGTSTALGVVPLGTGNLLAENLSIPVGLDAVPCAVSSTTTTLDVGVVNDEKFLVMAGVGFDAAMIRDADSTVKRRFGSVAYMISGAKNLPAQIVRASVTVDGEAVWSGRTAMVLVGNCGAVTGGLQVFPDAAPDDGRLDIAILTAERLRDWLTIGWRLMRRREQPKHLVERYTGTTVTVDLDEPAPYELDGEDRPETDRLEFTIEPAALEVRCP